MNEPAGGASSTVVRVTDLLGSPGRRRSVKGSRALTDLTVGAAEITNGEVDLSLVLESQAGRIFCSGEVRACWQLECRRCLEPLRVAVAPVISEVFELSPTPDETFPISGETVDLEPMLRQVILVSVPSAPLCDASCAGPAEGSYLTVATDDDASAGGGRDPRWAALDDFKP